VSDFRSLRGGFLLDSGVAEDLAISNVARVFGLRTSAIRYYEQIGILPPATRKNGQRRYDNSVLFRLAVVQRARETGFTLEEIRELFFGFPPGTRPPKRWQQLSQRKIAELRNRMKRLKLMETLLRRLENCRCDALDECGERILRQDDQESQPPSHEASAYGLDFGVTSRRAKEVRRKK
jgi:MerR family redox-sensitive transcriptional activator SoxR